MQLLKEENARKRIHNGSLVQIENSVTQITVRHHSASLMMPNSYPCDGIFNQHLTTIIDSHILLPLCGMIDQYDCNIVDCSVILFVWLFNVPVNNYGSVKMVS